MCVAVGQISDRLSSAAGEKRGEGRKEGRREGGMGQRLHSLPVVRSFRTFWRFWMAVPTSSYCRALPAYLQYF